eukprot:c2982_g1_i1.p1 GENE.c2982_g1_i1~~c2982_g1_i1.p1  ORF type:complete len:515 (-),score=131.20 c2982_g1_i1:178-1686(-)
MSGRGKKRAKDDDVSSDSSSSDSDASTEEMREIRQIDKELAMYGEDMIADDEDRNRLDEMTQLDREMLLAERWERHEELTTRRGLLIKKLPRDARKRADKLRKRSRQSSAALAQSPEPQTKDTNRASMDDELDDLVASAEIQKPKTSISIILEDLLQIQVKREDLEKWVNEIFFNKVVIGLFVRILLGPDKTNRKNRYKIAEIIDVKDGEVYELRPGTLTSKWIQVELFDDRPLFEMKFVSNKPFLEEEYDSWLKALQVSHTTPPAKSYCTTRKGFREEANNFVYTEDAINKVVEYKQRLNRNRPLTAQEKVKLLELKATAEDAGDLDAVRKLTDELRAHERLEKEFKKSNSMDRSIAKINEKNKKLNQQMLLKSAAKASEMLAKAQGGDKLDPFSRRRTCPSYEVPAPVSSAIPQDKPKSDESPMLAAVQKRKVILEDTKNFKNTLSGIDVGLDIDPFSVGGPPPLRLQPPPQSASEPRAPSSAKKITLGQYLNRRATQVP